jgi:hypothetical protein
MELGKFGSLVNEACADLPEEVRAAIRIVLDYAKTKGAMPFTDHIDTSLLISGGEDASLDEENLHVSLCLRNTYMRY